jgi:hypothetical protein
MREAQLASVEFREAVQLQKAAVAVMLVRASCRSYRAAADLVAGPVVVVVAPSDADKIA